MDYSGMTTEDIEKAVEQLTPSELTRFRAWFEEFEARQFDATLERGVRAGKFDTLAEEALAEHRAGRSREL
jgi:pimeloyl-CoA synthetase